MNTARTSVASVRPKITAWTTARLIPFTGMTTRCSRWGVGDHVVIADGQLGRLAAYWRWMNVISPTRTGIRTMTISDWGALAIVTTTATIAVSVQPNALIASRRRQPGGRSRRQCRIIPAWLIVKSMNTPTA